MSIKLRWIKFPENLYGNVCEGPELAVTCAFMLGNFFASLKIRSMRNLRISVLWECYQFTLIHINSQSAQLLFSGIHKISQSYWIWTAQLKSSTLVVQWWLNHHHLNRNPKIAFTRFCFHIFFDSQIHPKPVESHGIWWNLLLSDLQRKFQKAHLLRVWFIFPDLHQTQSHSPNPPRTTGRWHHQRP